jgi:hypothetical protein
MLKFPKFFLAMLLMVGNILGAQQTQQVQQGLQVSPPGDTELITPVNLQPLDLEELARRKGISNQSPARNIVILSGFGFIEDAAAIFRSTGIRKLQLDQMENFALVLPRFVSESEHAQVVRLADLLVGDGRAVGLVSDSNFKCASACEFMKIQTEKLFENARMALTLGSFSTEEDRDETVRKFCRRNIEYARNRKDLNRLFSAKAEKIVGAFDRNINLVKEDQTQPFFDELVTACLSRLPVAGDGFVLLIGAGAAEQAAAEGRYFDMLEHLRVQEKVLHQINYFVSGRKDTLVLLIQDSGKMRWKYGKDFKLSSFIADLSLLESAMKAENISKYLFESPRSYSRLLKNVDAGRINELIAAKDKLALYKYLQDSLKLSYDFRAEVAGSETRLPGFAVFSRGLGTQLFRGMITFEDFVNYLSLISGVSSKSDQE